ncbi:YuzB family protein [Listeria costaricensis]|uniref:YuzB family protein n=1 Tax=Listeria costaricensis TaxID=2026604 RepID=UPI000C08D734|nr:YuzB family protein [Listeria costaricensis]
MNPIVEFCVNNLASGAQEVYEALDKDPGIDVIEYDCLTYCDLCATSLFALVDGEVIRAETAADLLEKIYQFIEENPF